MIGTIIFSSSDSDSISTAWGSSFPLPTLGPNPLIAALESPVQFPAKSIGMSPSDQEPDFGNPMSAEFGIYVHWPYCESKCPYCDFNSHVADTVDHGRWRAAYLSELDRTAGETGDRTVTSVFFGGGTPSLMKPDTAAAIIERIRANWPVAGRRGDHGGGQSVIVGSRPVRRLRRCRRQPAVHRRPVLRRRSAEVPRPPPPRGRGQAAPSRRRREAVPRFSFDLIYALPGQTVDDWRRQLSEAVELARGHLSVYQLAIEPGTEFHKRRVEGAGDETAARALRGHSGSPGGRRAAGLRDFQPRRPGQCLPAQSHLLAGRRLCGHRSRRPRAAQDRRRLDADPRKTDAGRLAQGGRNRGRRAPQADAHRSGRAGPGSGPAGNAAGRRPERGGFRRDHRHVPRRLARSRPAGRPRRGAADRALRRRAAPGARPTA